MRWSERIRPCVHCHRQFDRGAIGRLRFCSLKCAEQGLARHQPKPTEI